MKKIALILTLGFMSLGCAQVMGAVLPVVEAKADQHGVGLSVGVDVNYFCVETGGDLDQFLTSVPFLGAVVKNLVGPCPVSEPEV
jgi:hypothetical protein